MLISQAMFIFLFLLIAGIGIFVLLRNPTNIINKRFCVFAQAVAVWIFFIYFLLQTTDPAFATFRLRLVFCAAVFIPSSFFFFFDCFS